MEDPKSSDVNFSSESDNAFQQCLPDVTSPDLHVPGGDNIDNHHQEVGADNSGSSLKKIIPDFSSLSLKLSRDVNDAALLSSENPATPLHSSEMVERLLLHIPQQLEDGSSLTNGITINYPSASIIAAKTEKRSFVQPVQLNHWKDMQKNAPESAKPDKQTKRFNPNRATIDTASPFESVKEVVSKFGGMVDWKARRVNSLEKPNPIQLELERVQKEILELEKQSQVAEEAKAQVVRELESTKRLSEELKLNLERAQTEIVQAKQDSELAQLRPKEMERGIAGESSIASKAQLEVAKARCEAAVAELKSVKEDTSVLEGQYASLLKEKGMSRRKVEEAVSASKEIEKTVEEVTLKLITTKEALELAHAAYLESDEHRISAAREQDYLTWEKELRQLNQRLLLSEDTKPELDTTSNLLVSLNVELAAYMEEKLNQESEGAKESMPSVDPEEGKVTHNSAHMLASIREELEEVKRNIDKAKEEINCLKNVASSLKSEIEREKSAFSNLQEREPVTSLVAEHDWTKQELEVLRVKEKEAREKMLGLPKLLQQACQEANQGKSVAQLAKEELCKAKQEAKQVNACATTTEFRLRAALKEIEAAKSTERLALAAIKALEESEHAALIGGADLPAGVTLSLEEYFNLSKNAYYSEQLAQEKVEIAMSQIEAAERAQQKCTERVDEAYKELEVRKEALRAATEKAEMAKEGKLAMEEELRKWRAENEERRKASDATKNFTKKETNAPAYPVANHKLVERPKKKKRSLIPRIIMFLAKRKQQSTR